MYNIFTFIADDIARLDYKKFDGFIVTGLIKSGQIKKNDEVLIITPNSIEETEIYSIEKDGKIVDSVLYSDCVGILLPGSPPEDAIQSDDRYNVSWLSFGLISAPEKMQSNIDGQHDVEIGNLRSVLPNPVIEVEQATASYMSVLMEKFYKFVYIDEYDTLEGLDDFELEINRFIKKKLPTTNQAIAKHIINQLIKAELSRK